MLLPSLPACGLLESEAPLRIEVDGRLERGLTADLVVTKDGEAVPFASVSWEATPAAAAEFVDGGVRLLEAGTLTLRAVALDTEGQATIEVAVPPEIVLDGVRDGNRDVFRVFLDGRDATRLTTDPGEDADPSVAGGTVAFTSYRGGSGDVWTVPVGGGTPTRIEAVATSANERQPDLSADGTRVAFVRSEGGLVRVWTGAVGGGEPARVTEETSVDGGIEGSPAWAPDGRLALMSTVAGDADVYYLDVEAGVVTEVAVEPGPQVEPAWSPDGGSVAYAAVVDGDAELVLRDLATDGTTTLTTRSGADGQPAFLADGRVVYTAFTDDGSELRWLDPTVPGESHVIPFDGERPENPSAVRP